ncbi:MAG: PAS domain S-box protein [Deltaproteobacteria bacterium]|nr:MAG: PAS domain S-box protein [Deltaproteobacteria bacterium]
MPPPLDADGLRLEVRQLRDQIARLRADEATYRDIVNRTNSIVLRWDPEGRVIFLNDYGQSFFGYTSDELVGHSVLGLIVPDAESSGRDLNAMIHDLLRHPERYLSNENENVRRDGDRVWITWRNTPIVDAEGRLVEILSTGIDTTERKRAEDALRLSEKRFRELALLDNLTGLYNTRYLYQALDALIAASAAEGTAFSVLFVDLDHFKRVVDSRGGVATYPDDARDLESLLAMGDQALFAVKRSGRDGIIAAGARDPAGT